MTTIKSHTDLEQSKKLAEILPIDSADMHYGEYCAGGENFPIPNCDDDYNGQCCWSLAALLAVLPSGKALIHDKESGEYKCICYNYDTAFYSNPIDACYELILKLHEFNLL